MNSQPNLDTRPVRCLYATRPDQRPHCQLSAVVRYGTAALCADCDTRRSSLGKAQRGQPLPTPTPIDTLAWIREADQALRTAHAHLAAAVHRARQQGHTWASIGTQLHTSRQAAQQRFNQDQQTGG